jgi:hypothetical protein
MKDPSSITPSKQDQQEFSPSVPPPYRGEILLRLQNSAQEDFYIFITFF